MDQDSAPMGDDRPRAIPPSDMASYVPLPGPGTDLPSAPGNLDSPSPEGPRPPYELKRLIGRGGQGEVWEAWQSSLMREVAVKVHHQGSTGDFLSEALLTGRLDHPGIVPVLDLGSVKDPATDTGRLVMAMKRVRGHRWDQLLATERNDGVGRSLPFLRRHLGILGSVCQAVAYAHSCGVVHLDLKPSQIMVGSFGEVFVMDWGMAAGFGNHAPPGLRLVSDITDPVGTPAYMAPEQALGDGDCLGTATDIYLLGALAYSVLTGTPPHPGSDLRERFDWARKNIIPSLPRDTPPALAAVINKALDSSPSQRQATAGEFRESLLRALEEATRHRDALAILETVRNQLATAAVPDYRLFIHLERELDRASGLLPDSGEVEALRNRVIENHARLALSHGDLELASMVAQTLDPSDLRAGLDQEIQRAITHRDTQRRQRIVALRWTFISITALTVVLAITVPWLLAANRRAVHQQEVIARALSRAEQELYRSSIQAAFSHAEKHKYGDARRSLAEAPAALRGWEWYFVSAMAHPEMQLYGSREETAQDLAVDATGQYLSVIRSRDQVLELRRTASGEVLQERAAGMGQTWLGVVPDRVAGFLAWSVDGRIHEIRLDQVQSSAPVPGTIRGVSAAPHPVLVSHLGEVYQWSRAGAPERIWTHPEDPARLAVADGTGTRIAVGTQSGRVWWRSAPGSPWIRGETTHTQAVSHLHWKPNSGELASLAVEWLGSDLRADRRLLFWNTDQSTSARVLTSGEAGITAVAYGGSPPALIIANAHAQLHRHSPNSPGTVVATVSEDSGIIRQIRPLADGNQIATVSRNHITIRNTETFAPLRHMEADPILAGQVVESGNDLITRGHTVGPARWRTDGPEHLITNPTWPHPVIRLESLASTDSLMTVGATGGIQFRQPLSLRAPAMEVAWHPGPLIAGAMARSGEVVASLSRAGDLRIQYHERGQITANVHTPGGADLTALALRSDGLMAIVGRTTGGLRVWQADQPNAWRDIPGEGAPDGVTAITWDGRDQVLAVGRESGRIDLLDGGSFRLLRSLKGHTQAINRLRIRGGTLISAGEDGTARIWGLEDGVCRTILKGSHAGGVTSADLTQDLSRAVTSCRDWGVRIFDTQTGVEYLAVQWHRYGVNDLVLSRDDSVLATLGLDGTLQWWITRRTGDTVPQ